jgi:hypothetical protein
MAHSLGKNDSAGKVARGAKRHLRLTKRTGNTEAMTLAERIRAPLAQLEATAVALAAAREALQEAFDDWVQLDRLLDRTVRSCHRKAVDYDADHAGAKTTATLFAGRAPSEITAAPRADEPDLVASLVKRGEALPAGHPATPLLGPLGQQAEASRAGHRAWVDAAQREAVAATAVEVARLAVVRTYRDNLIDIERAGGPELVEDCFPTLRRTAGSTEDDGDLPPGEPTPA